MSFFDEFNNMTPYFVRVNVGKNKQFKTDVSQKTYHNHKGKLVAFYKKASTLEELQKYGVGTYMKYIPAEQVSMPIDIQVTSDEEIVPKIEETSKYTNKERTNHTIRIFNQDNKQVGCAFLDLTPAGDIASKTYFYESPDKTEEIVHTCNNNFEFGKTTKDEHFTFKKNTETETKKIEISQREGKVVGAAVIEQELETPQDVAFQSITEVATIKKTPKLKTYVASCVSDETERKKRGGAQIPWECMTLENDLFEYQKNMEDFEIGVKWMKEYFALDITIEKAIEIANLSYDKRKEAGIPSEYNYLHYSQKAEYLSDTSNDLLKDFKGSYIGNILKLTDKGYKACIVTKHQKDGKDYRLYTLIDLTGTDLTQGTGIDYLDTGRDSNYFERLKTADKTPTFVTMLDEEGKENLVLYRGTSISEECPEYKEFVEEFIAPFSDIKPIQISKFINNQKTK